MCPSSGSPVSRSDGQKGIFAQALAIGALVILAISARLFEDEVIDSIGTLIGLAPAIALYLLMLILLAISLVISSCMLWRHPARRDASGLAGLLFLIASVASFLQAVCVSSFGLIAGDVYTMGLAAAEWDDARMSQIADGRISIIGTIGPHFMRDLAAVRGSHPIKTIDITSEGGLVDQALKFAREIETEGISVIVHDYCHSACILLAVASKDSYADEDVIFGFHRSSPIAEVKSEVFLYSSDILGRESSAFLKKHGVPDKVLAEAENFGPDSIYPVTASEMVEFGAIKGVVSNE